MTQSVEISELTFPTEPSGPGWDRLSAAVDLINAITRETVGGSDLDLTATQLRALVADPYAVHRLLLAERDRDLVGFALLGKDRAQETAWFDLGVVPQCRRQRIGTRLAAEATAIATAEGATILHSSSNHVDLDRPPRLEASTGAGSVPADAPSTRFLRGLGFALGQVELQSALDLPVPGDRLRELSAATRPAPDYELLDWIGPVPESLVDDFARIRTIASTAVPSGDLVEQEEIWDADRVRSRDRRHAEAGNTLVSTAVRHRLSGELVGFSNLAFPAAADGRAVGQGYTMVTADHRGHNLGLRIKINNLQLLGTLRHGARRILTGNADENDAMLSINRALGFRPVWVTGSWERAVAG